MRHLAVFALLFATVAVAAERPRLGVVIIIDQLAADTFRERLPNATAGLKRLATEGYVFHEARYEASPTITSVGHATLLTGAYAQVHGVVANDWLDTATKKPHLSTEDSAYRVLGREPGKRDGTAPTSLRAPTLSDAVKRSHEKALALSVSAKDRSAILCAGRAGLAVWFDAEKPFFTTSTFYAKEPPAFLTPVNERLAKAVADGALPWAHSEQSTRHGDSEPLAEHPELQAALDTAEVDVALEGLKALGLGKDDVPDLLTISFSGHDRIGHQFGPDSPESVADFKHLDREIGRLLTALDAQVGKGKYVVALSSDHGVAPMAELAKARGLDAGRIDITGLRELLEKTLDKQLGAQEWIIGKKVPGFTLNPAIRHRALAQLELLRATARTWPGVEDLVVTHAPTGPWAELIARGAYEGRSPDLTIVPKPHWIYGTLEIAGHGSPYLYDRAVPLVFFGAGVKKGRGGTTQTIHLAPTLAALLNVSPPAAAQGQLLTEVLP